MQSTHKTAIAVRVLFNHEVKCSGLHTNVFMQQAVLDSRSANAMTVVTNLLSKPPACFVGSRCLPYFLLEHSNTCCS